MATSASWCDVAACVLFYAAQRLCCCTVLLSACRGVAFAGMFDRRYLGVSLIAQPAPVVCWQQEYCDRVAKVHSGAACVQRALHTAYVQHQQLLSMVAWLKAGSVLLAAALRCGHVV
jgi:hypothetical protein